MYTLQKSLHNNDDTRSIGKIAKNIMYMQKGRATHKPFQPSTLCQLFDNLYRLF